MLATISPSLNREYELLRTSKITDTAYIPLQATQNDRAISHRSLDLLDIEPTGPSVDSAFGSSGRVRLISLDEARRTAHIVLRPAEML